MANDERENPVSENGPDASTSAGPSAPMDDPVAEIERLQQEVQETRAQAEDYLDHYRRSVAEFQNYRRRVDRERQQETQRVTGEIVRELLPVIDDFERAAQNAPAESADSPWMQGITLIGRKLQAVLRQFGVQPIEAVGTPFDPTIHEAVMQQPSDEYPEGIVVQEMRTGYMLDGQVIRPSMVAVSSGPQN